MPLSPSNPSLLQVEVNLQTAEGIPQIVPDASWEQWFDCWLTALAPDLSPINAYEVSLEITTDAVIQQFNAQYRQIDQPTDVLAFAALETEIPPIPDLLHSQPIYLGDIVISYETACRQAAEREHSDLYELAWLATHGLLHLLGWDHPDDEHLMAMLARQTQLLSLIDLSWG